MELRPYQEQAIAQTFEKWKTFKRLLLTCPTGAGKSYIFSKIAEKLVAQGERVLILAHRDELIQQARFEVKLATGLETAVEKADDHAHTSSLPITVGSVQSLMRQDRLDNFDVTHYDTVITDESHHSVSDSYARVYAHFKDAKLLGVTATGFRADKKKLGDVFEDLCFQYTIREAISDGWLCPVIAQTIPINIDLSSVKSQAGDFKERDVAHAIEPYLEQIAQAMWAKASNRKILVFLPLIETSQIMADFLCQQGFRAKHIDGKSPDRKEILVDFNEGKYNVLTNANLLSEGYNQPDVDCIVMLRVTRSTGMYIQCVGRGTRIFPGKDNLLLLDFLWHSALHNLCKPSTLLASTEEEAKHIDEKQDKSGWAIDLETALADAQMDIKTERESALARYIDAHKGKKSKTIDPVAFGLSIDDDRIIAYDPTYGWEKEEASDAQKQYLDKVGFDASTMTKGYASKLLNAVSERRDKGLCTPRQMNCLMRQGLDATNFTFEEAKAKIDWYKKNVWKNKGGYRRRRG